MITIKLNLHHDLLHTDSHSFVVSFRCVRCHISTLTMHLKHLNTDDLWHYSQEPRNVAQQSMGVLEHRVGSL